MLHNIFVMIRIFLFLDKGRFPKLFANTIFIHIGVGNCMVYMSGTWLCIDVRIEFGLFVAQEITAEEQSTLEKELGLELGL